MKTPQIKTTRVALPQIYAYTTPRVPDHDGMVKIGYTEQTKVEDRIKQQCHTADIAWMLQWNGNAVFEGSNETFTDKAFHAYLNKLGYVQQTGTEWFHISPTESKLHFYEFRENHGVVKGKPTQSYRLRDSQADAVERTANYFNAHPGAEYLWNAKPRFGKTLAVYDLCLRMKFKSVLVVTNRPAIADAWYSDYLRFVGQDKYLFVSSVRALVDHETTPCLTRDQYLARIKQPNSVKNCIEFVSLQDLKGSRYFGGNFDKLHEVAKLQWDLLVIDEAHEGVDTFKTDQAFSNIKRLFTLHLSGTPFKALANEKFPAEAIFNWTYADEFKAKDDWDEDRGLNPYEEMPKLNMFTYRMSDIVMAKVREGVEIEGDTEAYAFDLNEFFRVDRGKFVHDEAIDKWLDALSRQLRYPFSTSELRHELRHTFWLLNRVDAAKKLAEKLRDIQRHPEFADFEIVVAAGDGKTDNDEVIEDEGALRRVRKAIADHPQGTITLSVGQLTTGVSVREWTGVLILSNMKSPAQYMQAAFRAQTPYLYKGSDGQFHRKENAYIFDFDPARTLTNYEEMANGLSADTASGGGDADLIAHSIEKYSEKKEKQGKSAEEQLIDHVSSQLTSSLLSYANEHSETTADLLTKHNQNAASVRIKKEVNEQFGAHCYQASIEKKQIDLQCQHDCQGKTTQQQRELHQKAEEKKRVINEKLSETLSEKAKNLLEKGTEILADTIEQQRIDKKKGETNEQVRDHLRGFSRTIPSFLMGYGDDDTTLQNFDSRVPDEVFLKVTSVTKEQFHLLRDGGDFVNEETGELEHSAGHFFDEVVFNDSVKEFMKLRRRLANYFEATSDEDIFNYIPPQKTNQIFTPKKVVRKMVDLLEKENPGCFDDPDKTFADLYMKSGQYITEIVKRLYNSEEMRRAFPDDEERLRHIFKHQIYGLAPTECIYRIALRYILGFDDTIHIAENEYHLRFADSLPAAKAGEMETFLDSVFKS